MNICRAHQAPVEILRTSDGHIENTHVQDSPLGRSTNHKHSQFTVHNSQFTSTIYTEKWIHAAIYHAMLLHFWLIACISPGTADRLFSCSKDMKLKVWALVFEEQDTRLFALVCMKVVSLISMTIFPFHVMDQGQSLHFSFARCRIFRWLVKKFRFLSWCPKRFGWIFQIDMSKIGMPLKMVMCGSTIATAQPVKSGYVQRSCFSWNKGDSANQS